MVYRSFWVLSSLALLFLSGCDGVVDYTQLAARRISLAEAADGPLVVSVIWPASNDLFREGIELAVTEINSAPGQVLGQPIEVRYHQEANTFDHTRNTIRSIAQDLDTIAVIGHRNPAIAIPASLIYEQSGLLYLAPFTTSQKLTAHNFQLIFRMVPGNELLAEQLISFCQYRDYQRLVVMHSRRPESREQAILFLDRALKNNLIIDTQLSFAEDTQNFRDALADFRNNPVDAIFIAGSDEFGGRLVRQIREFGMFQPIIGVDAMDSSEFLNIAGEAAENVILPTVYYAESTTNINEQFVSRFIERFGVPPDVNAAQAYDSVHLLAGTIRDYGSRVPVVLASMLRFLPFWIGVTGVHGFDKQGNVEGKKYFFQIRRGGRWEILAGAHTDYAIQRFLDYVEARDSTEESTTMPAQTQDESTR